MSIPLRELGLMLLLLPAAMGAAASFNQGVTKFDAFLFGVERFNEGFPPACSEEALITAWDVQLRFTQEQERDRLRQLSAPVSSPGDLTLLAREPL